MKTSQHKKGNPSRNSRAILRKHREEAALDRSLDLGLPYGPAVLLQCPHCDTKHVATLIGHTRLHRAVQVCERCLGDVAGFPTYHRAPPQRKKRRKRSED